jgi:hypothetical protein
VIGVDELYQAFDGLDDDELDFFLESLELGDPPLTKTLTLGILVRDLGGRSEHRWTLKCTGVKDHRVKLGWKAQPPGIYADHELLWEYQAPHATLYFNGRSDQWTHLLGELFRRHQGLSKGWYEFGTFLNRWQGLNQFQNGLFAEGPDPFMRAYQQVLQQFGFETSIIAGTVAKDVSVQVMECDKSFVIAESFELEQSG